MPERTAAEKFLGRYGEYQSAKSRKNAHWTKVHAISSIGELHKLVGKNYKDEDECAKVVKSIFIDITHQHAVEIYQELYDDSRSN